MNYLPDTRGPRILKRHPACPGKRRCKLPSCIHNAPISVISADEISVDLYGADGNHGAYSSETRVSGGASYQQLGAASESGSDDRKIDDEPTATIRRKMFFVQAKIREVSRTVLDRMKSCFC